MGYYDDYYKKYYSSIKSSNSLQKKKSTNNYTSKGMTHHTNSSKFNFIIFLNFLDKRFVNILVGQLIAVTLIIVTLIGTKIFPGEYTTPIYINALKYIENGFWGEKNFTKENVAEVFYIIENFIKIGEKKIDYIRDNYLPPIDTIDNYNSYEDDSKFFIKTENNLEIKASTQGRVKNINNKESSKLIIDYGEGIEMAYGNLDTVYVKEGEPIKKGQFIGQITGNSDEDHMFYIELFYMGENLQPSEWLLY